jgi:nitroreductase
MDFVDLVKVRQSDRVYMDKPIDRDLLITCVEAARLAPSSCNAQPWSVVIVDDPELKNKVAKTTMLPPSSFNKFVSEAPVIVVVIMEQDSAVSSTGAKVRNIQFPLIDIGAFAENFCLQAAELGLGTCMIGWVKEKELRKLLNIPGKKRIPIVITIGYPKNNTTREKTRKFLDELCKFNSY